MWTVCELFRQGKHIYRIYRMHLFESSHPLAQQLEETFTRPSGFTKPRKALAMGPWSFLKHLGHGALQGSSISSMVFFNGLAGSLWVVVFLGGLIEIGMLRYGTAVKSAWPICQAPALRARTRKNRCIRFSCRHPHLRPTDIPWDIQWDIPWDIPGVNQVVSQSENPVGIGM